MAQIGLKDLFYAPITEDGDGNETYGAPVRLAKGISADISVESDNAVLYADDGADVTIHEFQSGTITLGINELGNNVAAALLGATVDANGVLVSAGEDAPKPIAIGFRSRSAKGGDRYFWLYRVTFGIPGQTFNTKGESIEFSTPSIEGTISRRNRVDENGKHPWKAEVKAGEPGVTTGVVTAWFNTVYDAEAEDVTLATLTIGSDTLNPTFDEGVTEYTTTAGAASEEITATASDTDASVAITVNGNSITNGDAYTWRTGENIVIVTVTLGFTAMQYKVVVTKS